MSASSDLAIEAVDAMFPDEAGPGIALASFSRGSILEAHFRGAANLSSRRKIGFDTAFHVASISKQFTAFAVANLISEGHLDLEDSIGKYVRIFPAIISQLTIAELLYHTSGLSDQWALTELAGWAEHDPITTQDVNTLISRQKRLKHLPGTKFSYTNTGYTLLAEIVEAITGQSLDEYLRSEVFGPLGMSHTRFRTHTEPPRPYEAECYSLVQDEGYRMTTPSFATIGATSLRTSIVDVSLWADYLFNSASASVRLMHHPGSGPSSESINYGFGLYHGSLAGRRTLSHSGWDADFSAHVLYIPDAQLGAAAFSNSSRMNLELFAAAFLSSALDSDYVSSELNVRLSSLLKSLKSGSHRSSQMQQRTAYGFLSSGDVRIWETNNSGQLLRGGAIQRAEGLGRDRYMLDASLSTLVLGGDYLTISSTTQGGLQAFPKIQNSSGPRTAYASRSFVSSELKVTHRIVETANELLWLRPGRPPCVLLEVSAGLFFAEGFTLQVENDQMVVLSARTAPIRFVRF